MTRFDARRRKQRTTSGSLWSPEQLETRLLLSVNPLSVNLAAPIQLSSSSTINVSSSTSLAASLNAPGSVDVSGRSVTLNVVPESGDFASLRYSWQTVEVPVDGGSVTFTRNSSNAAKNNTLTFNRAGTYRVKVTIQSPGGTASEASIQINVVQVLTSLSASTSAGKNLSSTSQTLSGVDERLTASALDQFGRAMAEQPAVSWQIVKFPTGSSPTLTGDGNAVSVGFNRIGVYTVRAQTATLRLDGAITVAPVLTSFAFTTADGTSVLTGQTLTVSTASQRLNYRPIDQFGQVITSPPAIAWTTTVAPTGGKVTASLTSGVLNLTYSRLGQYTIEARIGGQTFSLSSSVVATLTSIGVRTGANREVGLKSPLSVTGTTQELMAIALDQYGAPLLEQPEVIWQSTSVAQGGTTSLTPSGNSVSVVATRAGNYGLQASVGSMITNVTLSYAQTLTILTLSTLDGTAVEPGGTVTVAGATVQLTLRGLDQFSEPMKSLPTTQWSTTLIPTGVTALPGLANGTAKFTFNRLGTFSIRIQNGSTSCSFNASVVPVLTTFRVRTANNQSVAANGTVSFAGTSLGLTASGVDQFGGELAEQPTVSWQSVAVPSGGSTTLTAVGNDVSVAVNRDGKYSLRVQSGAVAFNFGLTVKQTLTAMNLLSPSGAVLDPTQPFEVNSVTQKLTVRGIDQFGIPVTTLPKVVWTTSSEVEGGKASVSLSTAGATVTFNRVGSYSILAEFGSIRTTALFQVVPTVTSIVATDRDNRLVIAATPIAVAGTTVVLKAVGLDQFGQLISAQPQILWTTVTTPPGVQLALNTTGNEATLTFNRAGAYAVRSSFGSLALNLRLNVAQTATSFALTTTSSTVTFNGTRQLAARSLDQFEVPLATQPPVTWTATGGTISWKGLFTAGDQAGNFSITARSGALTSALNIVVVAPVAPTGLTDPALIELVNGYYGDGTLDRLEMIQILRSAGTDGTVNSAELTDFRFLVSSNTPFSMPNHVRSLASDVVNSNPANRNYKGQTAGDLAVGSGATLLNNLVDKWFLGADLPQISRSGLTYQTTVGNLFNGTPSRAETRQGQLGDCYFIAAVGAIADKNPDAVRNLFIDNGDETYTVRFYAGALSGSAVADYVTVNRQLPAYWNGTLGYSGYGQSVGSTTTTLWIALAEKAYAQWNETGNEGRDGTNRYSAIEGGWMFNVNAQILGYNSTNTYFATSNKQNLISALAANQAVTLGTISAASAGGLYGSHAYIVTAYNSSTDTFSLHNPWGVSHPTPLTWAQLQANCSIFVSTATDSVNRGTPPVSSGHPLLSQSASPARSTTFDDHAFSKTNAVTLLQGLDENTVSTDLSTPADGIPDIGFDTNSRLPDSCLSDPVITDLFVASDGSETIEFLMLDDQLLDIAFMDLDLRMA